MTHFIDVYTYTTPGLNMFFIEGKWPIYSLVQNQIW